ncbi:MAG TPA: GntR family transcriptional regulator [Terriglobales bacterium]|nr:GntR family transcriptional regulator [Terriglobales bacterium]
MRESADVAAYDYIRKAIIERVLLPSVQIVEQQVADSTGLSRTPIRNALKRLSYEGMVELRRNRGAFVVNPSHAEVRDTFEAKLLIDLETVRLAASQITEEELAEMERILARAMELHKRGDYDEFVDLNFDFHMVIAKAARNRMLEKYTKELMTLSNVHLLVYDDFRDVPFEEMESFREHRRIVEALRRRDELGAMKAMLGHLYNTYDTLKLSLPLRTPPPAGLTGGRRGI